MMRESEKEWENMGNENSRAGKENRSKKKDTWRVGTGAGKVSTEGRWGEKNYQGGKRKGNARAWERRIGENQDWEKRGVARRNTPMYSFPNVK